MVEKYYLSVFLALNLRAHAVVATLKDRIGVNVNNFSVTSVSKKKAGLRVCINLEVRRVVVMY